VAPSSWIYCRLCSQENVTYIDDQTTVSGWFVALLYAFRKKIIWFLCHFQSMNVASEAPFRFFLQPQPLEQQRHCPSHEGYRRCIPRCRRQAICSPTSSVFIIHIFFIVSSVCSCYCFLGQRIQIESAFEYAYDILSFFSFLLEDVDYWLVGLEILPYIFQHGRLISLFFLREMLAIRVVRWALRATRVRVDRVV
jgi:hypothetical protein